MKSFNQLLMELTGKDLFFLRNKEEVLEIPYIQERDGCLGYFLLQAKEGMVMIPYIQKDGKRVCAEIRLMDDEDRHFIQHVQDYWKSAVSTLNDSLFIFATSNGKNIQVEVQYDDLSKANPELLFHEELTEVIQEFKNLGWREQEFPAPPIPVQFEYYLNSPKGSGLFGYQNKQEILNTWESIRNIFQEHNVNYVERELTLADKL